MCKGFPNCCCGPLWEFEDNFNAPSISKCYWLYVNEVGNRLQTPRNPTSSDTTTSGRYDLPKSLAGISFFRSRVLFRQAKLRPNEDVRLTIEASFESDWQIPNGANPGQEHLTGPRVQFRDSGAMRLVFDRPPGNTTETNKILFNAPAAGAITTYTLPNSETILTTHELKLEVEMLFDGTPGYKARMWYQGTERIQSPVGTGTRTNINMTQYDLRIAAKRFYASYDSVFVQSELNWVKFKIEPI